MADLKKMLDKEVIKYIKQSVLCWLATSDKDNFPNVSPKEMFTYKGNDTLLIANIASPNSIQNIKENNKICVSFVDVFVQKGYKIKGQATIIDKSDGNFALKVKPLIDLYSDTFPISAVIEIKVEKVESIQAPNYFLFPEVTEEQQIKSALETYKV